MAMDPGWMVPVTPGCVIWTEHGRLQPNCLVKNQGVAGYIANITNFTVPRQ